MEKIRLKNGTEYNISSSTITDDKLSFTIPEISNFEEFKATLTYDALSEIKFYTEGDALSGVYENYTNVCPYLVDNMDVTVSLKKANAIEIEMETLKARVQTTQVALVEIYEMLLGGEEENE